MDKRVKDRKGIRYGRLVAVSFVYSKNRHAHWRCKCDCGNEKVVKIDSLVSGGVKSCGCLQAELRSKWGEEQKKIPRQNKGNFKHGLSGDRFYGVWKGMKNRCINPNSKDYKGYGERGIKLCKEWMDFNNFKADMFDSYASHYEENEGDTTIERVDVNGDYKPQNCVWATNLEQQKNRRTTKYVEYKGRMISVPELSEKSGVPVLTIHNRLNLKWDIERIVNTPVKRNKKTLRQ